MSSALVAAVFVVVVCILILADLDRWPDVVVSLCIVGAAAGSYLTSLRTIHAEDDILNYYDMYRAVGRGDWSALRDLGGGFELGLLAQFRLLHFLLGNLSLQVFIFWLTFIGVVAALGVSAWLTRRVTGHNEFALKMALVLVFVSFFTASHTVRQFQADIALLPLLVLPLPLGGGLLTTLTAMLFHLSSAAYALVLAVCRSRRGLLLLLVAGLLAVPRLEAVLGYATAALSALAPEKLTILGLQDSAQGDISNVPELIKLGLLSLLVWSGNVGRPDGVPVQARRFLYLGFVMFALLVDVPFLGNRLTHMMLNVAFGFIAMLSLRHSPWAMCGAAVVGLAYQTRLLLSYQS